ncbi:hypothetical protein M0R04_16195 [Candidatus Dojkabacteria bacterium]|jgi:hypothetical protein|nr:hypothetical protein [Candidatus Dojkabacteria bacterium]
MINYKELVILNFDGDGLGINASEARAGLGYDVRVRLDGQEYDAKLGKHCLWVPGIESKFVISLNGRPESVAWARGRNKEMIDSYKFISKNKKEIMSTLVTEYTLFTLLSEKKMSPCPGEQIKVKTFISSIFYPDYLDAKGIYGFIFPDANKLPAGKWNFDKFKQLFIDTGKIEASPGALGDLNKEGNVVNNYLIDVRRSIFDMMRVIV